MKETVNFVKGTKKKKKKKRLHDIKKVNLISMKQMFSRLIKMFIFLKKKN